MFESAKLKIEWANSHIRSLESVVGSFLQTDFYSLDFEFNTKFETTRIGVISKSPAPAEIYLLLGDAIHNLRSALDHIATEITGGGNDIYFPFHENRENFMTADGEIICAKCKRLEKACVNIGKFIVEEIRPFRSGDPFLWPLNKLDAIDKHKFLVPAIALTKVTAHDIGSKDGRVKIGSITGVATPGRRINVVEIGALLEVRGKIEADFQVHFTDETYFKDMPVISTLFTISEVVKKTIARIEKFVEQAQKA